MDYPVTCECSRTHQVSGGLAGATLNCTCGRQVASPSLSVLRAQAGQRVVSPALVVEMMLRKKELPEDEFCVKCKETTDSVIHFRVICERVSTKAVSTSGSVIGFGCLFSALAAVGGFFMMRGLFGEDGPEHARSVKFIFPLRLCPFCANAID